MTLLVVCLVIPPLVAFWPALLGRRFVVVAAAAALAAIVVWSVAFFVVAPADDTGPLRLFLLPLYTLIHTFFALAIVGIPWAIASQRRATG